MTMNLTDINDIRELLARHGFRFSKSLGQNFLTADWVPRRIADSALIDGETGVLEIGPGIGCLTNSFQSARPKSSPWSLTNRSDLCWPRRSPGQIMSR